jgi:DeoR family transcriptional regulator, fructose operon transcriptional repressor
MLIVERQTRLIQVLREKKTAQLEDLARLLDVSSSTVRRDLEQLEAKGLVSRTHGGAVYTGSEVTGVLSAAGMGGGNSGGNTALAERMAERVEEKEAIGRAAAKLVQPQMTLFLDGGSTVIYAVRYITARPLQIVTNSLSVANAFVDDDQVELVLVGGALYPRTGVTVGPIATGSIADLHADMFIFSLAGIYNDDLYNQNMAMAQVEQAMMRQAAQSVLLMDSSKFGKKSLTRVCGVSEIDSIITDWHVESEWREKLGGKLVVASSGRE